ncbi:hypothetical protein HYU21_04815 [Candidatus Woesearchaeota archaeon]|nr:hypothetical protein [Candidatus Woesearchaeota archaeon]
MEQLVIRKLWKSTDDILNLILDTEAVLKETATLLNFNSKKRKVARCIEEYTIHLKRLLDLHQAGGLEAQKIVSEIKRWQHLHQRLVVSEFKDYLVFIREFSPLLTKAYLEIKTAKKGLSEELARAA